MSHRPTQCPRGDLNHNSFGCLDTTYLGAWHDVRLGRGREPVPDHSLAATRGAMRTDDGLLVVGAAEGLAGPNDVVVKPQASQTATVRNRGGTGAMVPETLRVYSSRRSSVGSSRFTMRAAAMEAMSVAATTSKTGVAAEASGSVYAGFRTNSGRRMATK